MNILGKLGVDTKLLIAQMINFGLLLWLLKRFLYGSVVERIEKDERELNEAKTQKEKLEEEKNLFLDKKTKELTDARGKAEEIVAEAEKIKKKIEERSLGEAKRETERTFAQFKAGLESQKTSFRKEALSDAASALRKDLLHAFGADIPVSLLRDWQEKVFFADTLKQLKNLSLKNVDDLGLAETAKALEARIKNGSIKQKDYDEEIEKILSRRIGPVVLECAFSPAAAQKAAISKILAEKIGLAPPLATKLDKSLLSGFRLEAAGNVVESSLSNILIHAVEHAISEEK